MDEGDIEVEHWADLSSEQRSEIIKAANARIFWKQAFSRLQWLKGAATILLTLAAAWTIAGEALAEWLNTQGK